MSDVVIPDNAEQAMALLWPASINDDGFTVTFSASWAWGEGGRDCWSASIEKERRTSSGNRGKPIKVMSIVTSEDQARDDLVGLVGHVIRGEVEGFNAKVIEALS